MAGEIKEVSSVFELEFLVAGSELGIIKDDLFRSLARNGAVLVIGTDHIEGTVEVQLLLVLLNVTLVFFAATATRM